MHIIAIICFAAVLFALAFLMLILHARQIKRATEILHAVQAELKKVSTCVQGKEEVPNLVGELNKFKQGTDCIVRDHWDAIQGLVKRIETLEAQMKKQGEASVKEFSATQDVVQEIVRADVIRNHSASIAKPDGNGNHAARKKLEEIRQYIVGECKKRNGANGTLARLVERNTIPEQHAIISADVLDYIGESVWCGEYEDGYAIYVARKCLEEAPDVFVKAMEAACGKYTHEHFLLLRSGVNGNNGCEDIVCDVYGFRRGDRDENGSVDSIRVRVQEQLPKLFSKISEQSKRALESCLDALEKIEHKQDYFLKVENCQMVCSKQQLYTPTRPKPICDEKFTAENEAWLCLAVIAREWPHKGAKDNAERELERRGLSL